VTRRSTDDWLDKQSTMLRIMINEQYQEEGWEIRGEMTRWGGLISGEVSLKERLSSLQGHGLG
jgi:hypothetical protein